MPENMFCRFKMITTEYFDGESGKIESRDTDVVVRDDMYSVEYFYPNRAAAM